MPNIYGAATISGVNGLQSTPSGSADAGFTFTGLASGADQNIQDFDVTDQPNIEEHKNGNGEVLGFVSKDMRRMMTINFTPTGTTKDDCKEALEIPVAPYKVTLSEFPESAAGTKLGYNGDWVYLGGATVSWNDGIPRYRLPL